MVTVPRRSAHEHSYHHYQEGGAIRKGSQFIFLSNFPPKKLHKNNEKWTERRGES